MISVTCPHCGRQFELDPQKETVVEAEPEPPVLPGITYRPRCPGCSHRVTVRLPRHGGER